MSIIGFVPNMAAALCKKKQRGGGGGGGERRAERPFVGGWEGR